MKKVKAILSLILVATLLLALCACGDGKTETETKTGTATSSTNTQTATTQTSQTETGTKYTEKYNIVYATPDAAGGTYDTIVLQPFMKDLETFSGGRITLEVYYSSTLAGQGSIFPAIDSGTTDAGCDAAAMYKGVYLYSELVNAPGIDYGSTAAYSKLVNDYAEKYPDGIANYYILGRFAAGLFGFVTTNKAVEKYDDINGMAFRATSNIIPYMEAMGASGTMIPISELYESLRLNVVDGAVTSFDRITTDSYYDICNYFTEITWFIGDHVEALSQAYYDKMDPDAQAAMDKASGNMLTYALDWLKKGEENSLKTCQDGNPNFKYITLSDSERVKFVDAASGVLQSKVDELNAAGLDGDGAVEWLKTNAKKYA